MEKTIINTTAAPAAIGPYSQAVLMDKTLYISGQLGIQPESGELAGTIEDETHQSLKNIGAILAAAGMDYSHVVKTTIFVSDLSCFATVNGIYQEYFNENCPARACVQVAALPKGGLVEIEAVAVK